MKKTFRKIYDTLGKKSSFGKFVIEVLIFRGSRAQMFFKTGVPKNFAILEPFLIKLQAFFYRTPAGATFGFSRQQIPFSAKSGMYWRQSHRFLPRTPLKIRVNPQKQPLQLFCKKWCFQKLRKFHRKTSVLKSLFMELY